MNGRDLRDGVAEMALGVEALPLCVLGQGDYRRAVGGGYGPVEEARALDTLQGAIEGVDAAQNADAAMGAVHRQTYSWRLCWDAAAFGSIATETLERGGVLTPSDRLVDEARALATCLRQVVSIQFWRFGRGWIEWDIARPIETCIPGRRSADGPVGAHGLAPADPSASGGAR